MLHFQTGVWVTKLGSDDCDEDENPTAANYKAWEKRFSENSKIPITTFIMCGKSHLHTWDTIFPDGSTTPSKFFCDANTNYDPSRNTPCDEPLFREYQFKDEAPDSEDQNLSHKTKYKPLYLYPVFDYYAQLEKFLKRPLMYDELTRFKSLVQPQENGVYSEIYHGEAFQEVFTAVEATADDSCLDIYKVLYMDGAQLNRFTQESICPIVSRVLNLLLPDRNHNHNLYVSCVFTRLHSFTHSLIH